MAHGVFGPAFIVKFENQRSSSSAAERFVILARTHNGIQHVERTEPDEHDVEEVDVYPKQHTDMRTLTADLERLFQEACEQ